MTMSIEPTPGLVVSCDVAFAYGGTYKAKVEVKGIAGANANLSIDWEEPVVGPGTIKAIGDQLIKQESQPYSLKCADLAKPRTLPPDKKLTCHAEGPRGPETLEIIWQPDGTMDLHLAKAPGP